MSNSSFTHVLGAIGFMHTGDGSLNVNYPAGVATRGPRVNAVDHLEWVWQRFVYPAGFGHARELLETRRIVLLDGASGNGRIASAQTLLYETSSGGERFRELLWEEEKSKQRLNSDHIGDDDRVWLDLSGVEEWVWSDVQHELSAIHQAVIDHGAYLVVVLPDTRIERLRPNFDQYRAEIGRPPALEVLRRHLRLADVPDATTSPTTSLLTSYLNAGPPIREIAAFAGLVAQAWVNSDGKGDFPSWCATAHKALTGRAEEVAKKVTELHDGPQRALLLSTAMLHKAHADHVYHATAALLKTVEQPEDTSPPLERSDLIQRFQDIDAEITSDGHVRFKKLGYDSAVRAHFWNHMPGLRNGIQTWTEKTVDSVDLEPEDLDRLIGRFAEQCLHPRYRQALVESVFRWTKEPTTNRRLWAAHLALRRGLTAEEHGRFFRRQIYTWSRDRNLPEGLAQVIIVMCAEVIAVRHPDEAMVRLHHRARREGRNTIAREALVQLVDSDPRLRRQMLVRLARPSADGREREVDPGLFLELTAPAALTDRGSRNHPLIAEAEVGSMLTDGWRRVFARLAYATWREYLRQWLSAALSSERHREALLDALVNGSEGRGDILGHLYAIARGLPRTTADERKRHADFLGIILRKICAAQGVQVT